MSSSYLICREINLKIKRRRVTFKCKTSQYPHCLGIPMCFIFYLYTLILKNKGWFVILEKSIYQTSLAFSTRNILVYHTKRSHEAYGLSNSLVTWHKAYSVYAITASMAHCTLNISYCIPIIERFRKIIHACKFIQIQSRIVV